jgi:hypothetical protein
MVPIGLFVIQGDKPTATSALQLRWLQVMRFVLGWRMSQWARITRFSMGFWQGSWIMALPLIRTLFELWLLCICDLLVGLSVLVPLWRGMRDG